MVKPVLLGDSLSSPATQQSSHVRTADDSRDRKSRRMSSLTSGKHQVSRRSSYRRSYTLEKSRSSVGDDESVQNEWRSKTASQLTLASSVQDNLLEEVFKLQAALDNANSRLTAALTQNDLLQYDLNEAQNEIKDRDKGTLTRSHFNNTLISQLARLSDPRPQFVPKTIIWHWLKLSRT